MGFMSDWKQKANAEERLQTARNVLKAAGEEPLGRNIVLRDMNRQAWSNVSQPYRDG